MNHHEEEAVVGDVSRRDMLRKTAAGAGLGAAALAAPTVTGLGIAPAFGASASPCDFDGAGVTSLVLGTPVVTNESGAALVCGPTVTALTGSALAPIDGIPITIVGSTGGGQITIDQICAELDLCSVFNAQLAAAQAGVPAGVALTDFSVTLGGTVSIPVNGVNVDIVLPPTVFGGASPVPLAPCATNFCSAPTVIDCPPGVAPTIGQATFAGELELFVSIGAPFLCTVTADIGGSAAIPAEITAAVAACAA